MSFYLSLSCQLIFFSHKKYTFIKVTLPFEVALGTLLVGDFLPHITSNTLIDFVTLGGGVVVKNFVVASKGVLVTVPLRRKSSCIIDDITLSY